MANVTAKEVTIGMEFVLAKTPNFICYKTGVKRDKNYRFEDSFDENEVFVITAVPHRSELQFLAKSENKEYVMNWAAFRSHMMIKK